MHTTRELLDQVKQRHKIPSDGALSRALGLSRQAISHHMHGRVFLGQDTALRVAELLDMSPDYVIACAEAERAQTDKTRRYWRDLAQRAGSIAAAVLVAVFVFPALAPESSDLSNQINGLQTVSVERLCIMSSYAAKLLLCVALGIFVALRRR